MTSDGLPICSSVNTLPLVLCSTTGFSPYDNGESPPWAIRQIGQGRGNPNTLRDSHCFPYNSRSVSLMLAVCWTQLSAPRTAGSLFIKGCCIMERQELIWICIAPVMIGAVEAPCNELWFRKLTNVSFLHNAINVNQPVIVWFLFHFSLSFFFS